MLISDLKFPILLIVFSENYQMIATSADLVILHLGTVILPDLVDTVVLRHAHVGLIHVPEVLLIGHSSLPVNSLCVITVES